MNLYGEDGPPAPMGMQQRSCSLPMKPGVGGSPAFFPQQTRQEIGVLSVPKHLLRSLPPGYHTTDSAARIHNPIQNPTEEDSSSFSIDLNVTDTESDGDVAEMENQTWIRRQKAILVAQEHFRCSDLDCILNGCGLSKPRLTRNKAQLFVCEENVLLVCGCCGKQENVDIVY